MRATLLLSLLVVACGGRSELDDVTYHFEPDNSDVVNVPAPKTQLTLSWRSSRNIGLKVVVADLQWTDSDGSTHNSATDVQHLVNIEQTGGGTDGTVYFFVKQQVCFTAKYFALAGGEQADIPVTRRYCIDN